MRAWLTAAGEEHVGGVGGGDCFETRVREVEVYGEKKRRKGNEHECACVKDGEMAERGKDKNGLTVHRKYSQS